MGYGIGGRINADIFAVKRDKIFVILGLLERTEMIRSRATKKHTVITLVNWSRYQIEETQSGHNPDTNRTREKKGKEREEEIALPEELDTPDFRKAWNEDQKWLIKKVKVNGVSDIVSPKKVQELREETVGWEFVETETASNGKQYIVYKKPVDNWPALPQLKKNDYFYYRDTDLNSIYP